MATKNYNEQFAEMSKVCIEPFIALTELNSKTLNRIAKGNHLESFLHAKEASDIFEAQREFINTLNTAAMNYAQELTNIVLEASANFSKQMTHMAGEFGQKASEFTQKGTEAFKSSAQSFKSAADKATDRK